MCRKVVIVCTLVGLGAISGRPLPSQAHGSGEPAGLAAHLPEPWTVAPSAGGARPAEPVAARRDDDPTPPADPGYIPDHLIVRFEPGVSDSVKQALHEQYGAQVIREIPQIGVQVLKLSADALAMASVYSNQKVVRYAEPDYLASVFGWPDGPPMAPPAAAGSPGDGPAGPQEVPNDPLYPQQWHHAKINSSRAWDVSHGDGVTIAIVDTGVDCDHPDLRGKCVAGYDHFNNDPDPRDDHGHGTHVAGIAASLTNNAIGGAATGWNARIMPVKALGSSGNGGLASIGNAVVWATDHEADVINMSLGGFFTSRALQDAVAYAINRNVTVIAAAGNESTSNPTYPASYVGVIGVAATTQSDTRASFSNYGSYVDVAAPGVGILSTVRGGSYQAWSGTSMASPVVAGVAGLLVAQGPCRTPKQVEDILEQTADDIGTRGPDQYFGAGRINAGNALALQPNPCGGPGTPAATPDPNPVGATATAAAPTPAPSAVPPPDGDCSAQVEGLINRQRANFNLGPLASNAALRRAADGHALDMAIMRRCTHTGSNGSDPFARMTEQGYASPYGEIVACGQTSPDAAVQAWMNSAGHRAIILCPRCTEVGAGCRTTSDGYRFYWAVNFGSGRVTAPSPTLAPQPTGTPTATRAAASPTPPPPTALPTSIPGHVDAVLRPARNRIGWVVSSEPTGNHFDSSFTYTGTWNDRYYHGAMQFDLGELPAGAYIHFARLTLTGQPSDRVNKLGTWSVNLLDTDVDAGFEAHAYPRIHGSAIEAKLLPLLNAGDIDNGVRNVFSLSPSQVAVLQARLAGSRLLSVRMDGPVGGDFANLASWHTGYGPDSRPELAPELWLNYTIGTPQAVPTATATEPLPPSATPAPPTAGPSPTPTETSPPPTATATAPPPLPTALPTATLIPPLVTPPSPGFNAIDIPALPADTGWVRQFEVGNHLGDPNTYTGVYQRTLYHGMTQFDLSAIPPGASIQEVHLILTGNYAERLSPYGNGQWEIRLLAADVDPGWQLHGFDRISDADELATLLPVLRQTDLDAGRANVFALRESEVREVEWRASTTGRISFRFDGPRVGPSNIFSWDAGPSGTPPRLSIVYGPPRSDQPLPNVPTDEQRIQAIVDGINGERARAGLPGLAISASLRRAAEQHTWDMTSHRFFDHIGSDGSTPAERVARAGFRASAVEQLIAANSGSAEQVLAAWMGSAAHRDRILSRQMTHIGAFYDYAPGSPLGHYWTVDLAAAAP